MLVSAIKPLRLFGRAARTGKESKDSEAKDTHEIKKTQRTHLHGNNAPPRI